METLILTAYSKAPQGTSMYEEFKHLGVVLEIDKENHIIMNVEFTFITQLANDYFKRLLIGKNILIDYENILNLIKENYVATSRQAVIVALRLAIQRYVELCKNRTTFLPRKIF